LPGGSPCLRRLGPTGFETHTRQHKLASPTYDDRVILGEARALLVHSKLQKKPVRLIGVGVSEWQRVESTQVDLFDQPQKRERDERLLKTLDLAADRFGKGVLQLGCSTKSSKRRPE